MRDFDVPVEQQVFLCGEVVKQHVVLHTHPHILPDNFLVSPDVFAIHKDSTWWCREQPSQNRSEGEKINGKGSQKEEKAIFKFFTRSCIYYHFQCFLTLPSHFFQPGTTDHCFFCCLTMHLPMSDHCTCQSSGRLTSKDTLVSLMGTQEQVPSSHGELTLATFHVYFCLLQFSSS